MMSRQDELRVNYEAVCNKQNDLTPYAQVLHYMAHRDTLKEIFNKYNLSGTNEIIINIKNLL